MENFDDLLIVPLHGTSREEHMGNLSEGQCRMRIQKFNTRWCNVDVPLGEISMHKNEEIYDIREAEWYT